MSRFAKLLKPRKRKAPKLRRDQANVFTPQPPTDDERAKRDKEAKDAGLIVLVSGEVYERQLEHQKRPKEIRDYHLFIEFIDGRYVCYWRAYSNNTPIKDKLIVRGDWGKVIKRAKNFIDWWDNKRKT